MLKLFSFLWVLAVAIAAASSTEVYPESEVYPMADMGPENTNSPWTSFEPEIDAHKEVEIALDREIAPETDGELETYFDPESDTKISRCAGHKIMGGCQADISDHPYQVSVEQLDFPSISMCSGSIISPQWVLTAAHCALRPPSAYHVRAGSNYFTSGGTRYSVLKVHRHSGFDQKNGDYDIAVMRIAGTFNYGASVKPVRLTNSMPQPGTPATVAGWGQTSHNGEFSENLLAASLTVTSQKVCKETFLQINERKFCAGYVGGSRGPCGGDSGGPLVSGGVQVGIVVGSRCDRPKYPSVYTNVFYFRKWIKSYTGV